MELPFLRTNALWFSILYLDKGFKRLLKSQHQRQRKSVQDLEKGVLRAPVVLHHVSTAPANNPFQLVVRIKNNCCSPKRAVG
ncbi:hypothetical protein FRX31_005471 [Thalictrum thalictroides]|uniref:Uncharacterized protein n=1 Tax=Thalictrum thalictroides TaxID=46969 RepID=A0A7J6X966_THATH|nr:hypothetical protein FRX31_005471 [Thalictrum thalictroides]